MTTIGERIRGVRKSHGLTLEKFGEKIGITASSLSTIENGKSNPSEQTIRAIIREFHVDEVWLRTGAGEMFAKRSRSEEMHGLIDELMNSRPDSFRSALLTTLLRFSPEQWELLESIYNSVQGQMTEKNTDTE